MELSDLPETVAQTLEILSEKLATPAEQLLEVAVTGVRVEGIAQIILSMAAAVLLLLIAKSMVRKAQRDDDWYMALSIPSMAMLIAIIALYDGIIRTFAPAYWILKQLLNI